MRERIVQALNSSRAIRWLAAIAFALTLPALGAGLQSDDRIAADALDSRTDYWTLFSIPPGKMERARQIGLFAWWTSPKLSVKFLRPIASLSHALDHRLWPHAPWAMHLTNSLLYVLLVVVAAQLYRQFLPTSRLAGVAALLFAIDEGHAPAVGWISSRNTLLASLFALLCLLTHVRAREQRRPQLHALSALCLALALLSSENGVAALANLAAYAIVFERGRWTTRLASLAPELAVFAGWAALYAALGCGVRGAGWYRDLAAPFTLLREGVLDLPLWLASLVGPSIVSVSNFTPEAATRLVAWLVVLPLLAPLVLALPHSKQNRFFALGTLLSLPPLFTTHPQDRLLIAASVGAFGLLASFLDAAQASPSRWLRGYGHGLVAVHFTLAPLLFIPMLNSGAGIDAGAQVVASALAKSSRAQVVIVNTPMELLPMYAYAILGGERSPSVPQSVHQLYVGPSELVAERIDANTLELSAARGWGSLPAERLFCAEADMPRTGSERGFTNLHVAVRETNAAGMPIRVRFRFPTQLESAERSWFRWQGTQLRRWQPPAVGERETVPGLQVLAAF